jgi:hypothetical protein
MILAKKLRAQTSMEFVILTGFMLMAFLVFYIVIQAKLVEANRDVTDNEAKQVETLVVNELKVAESVTDNYYRTFELPQRVNGLDYQIKIISGVGNVPEIVTQYSGRERVYYVPQTYVSSSSRVSKGWNNISKVNGIILLQNMTS